MIYSGISLIDSVSESNPLSCHYLLLVKGNIVRDIEYHLRCQCLIGKHIKHLPYKEGANMYVAKYICDDKINWGLIKN